MVPVLQFVSIVISDVQVLSLPGSLVISQVFPLNQVVHVVLFVHTEHTTGWLQSFNRVKNSQRQLCECVNTVPSIPVVKNAVDHHPLHLYAIAIIFLLHLCVDRVFVFAFVALVLVTLNTKVNRWGLVHVVLTLVVAEHHLTVQLQLDWDRQRENGITLITLT